MAWRARRRVSWCLPGWGEQRGDALAKLLDLVEDRGAGAAQGGRVAGPGGLGAEQQVAVPVAALVARDVGGQPGPRDVLGVPQVHHPRIGQPAASQRLRASPTCLSTQMAQTRSRAWGWAVRI